MMDDDNEFAAILADTSDGSSEDEISLAAIFAAGAEIAKRTAGPRDCGRSLTVSKQFQEYIGDFTHVHKVSQIHLMVAGMALVSRLSEKGIKKIGKNKSIAWEEMIADMENNK